MIHPDNPLKQLWNLFVTLTAVAVGLEMPLRIALDYPLVGSVLLFECFVTLVFALDILLHVRTSLVRRRVIVSSPKAVAQAYLRGWFFVDVLAAIPFELLFAWGLPVDPLVLNAFRAFRIVKLLKISLLSQHFRRWDVVHALSPRVIRLCVFGMGISLLSHWIACGWIVIGGVDTATEHSYLRALYWTVTTLSTVGYGDITPVTPPAMIYTMVVMLLGVGMYAYIIGTIASIFAESDHARLEHKENVERMDRVMTYYRLPRHLKKRVRDYYQYLWDTSHGLDHRRVGAQLPEPLYLDITLYLLSETLESFPLFKNASPEFVRMIVLGLHHSVYSPGDYIIRKGEFGDRMFFISKGKVEVVADDGESILTTLGEGSYFGEMALLYDQPRTANVRSVDFCETYTLGKGDFDRVLARFPGFEEEVRLTAESRLRGGGE